MNAFLQFFSGKKTYLTTATIGVLLFGTWQAWWTIPNDVYLALMALALAFLRNGISKGPPPPAPAADPQPQPKISSGPLATALMLFSWATWFRPWVQAAALTAIVLIASGCAPLQPGADPLLVNTERVELVGKSTFDLVLNVDNSNRPYWATNAPAFHNFCQWLRQPQTIEQTNTLPRAAAMLLSLDDVKQDYKASRASSNALIEALATFQGVLDQAQAWQTLLNSTNR